MQDDYQELKDRLMSEIVILNGKLDSLEDFRVSWSCCKQLRRPNVQSVYL